MKKLHVAASPLTGTIYAGTLLKDNRTWSASRCDVTIDAIVAVAEHALIYGKPVEVREKDGTLVYRLTVERGPAS